MYIEGSSKCRMCACRACKHSRNIERKECAKCGVSYLGGFEVAEDGTCVGCAEDIERSATE